MGAGELAAAADSGGEAAAPVRLSLPDPAEVEGLDPPPVEIVDPHGSLARFFSRTEALLRDPSAVAEPVRIAVYGDSNGTMDYITGEMRRVLQTAYGDAGHGFVALARPWPWYIHQYVVTDSMKDAWWAYTVTTHPTPTMDPWYGQGMIAAQSKQKGAQTWVSTAPEGSPIGTRVARFEVWYVTLPYGGAFDVQVDGDTKASADTHADGDPHFGFVRVDVPDGPHKMTAVSTTARPVRLIGAVLDRAVPGFQVDGLGVGSQNCLCVLRESEALDREIFAHRPYDLIVFHIGRRVEEQLRRAADEAPAAFFDFHQAMGGQGSMARFQQHHMTQGDYLHLNAKGGAYVGDRIVAALARSLRAWESR